MGRSMVKSDILVIGGSGAGVMSAVTASREGAEVVLVSKGKVGKNGNAIMLGGSFGVDGQGARDVCGEADANQEYTAESLFEKMVACAFGLGNQELQKRFVEDG
ncbi:MAG: FAD-dependent oxidoreductase, partial [Clostridium sp.]|nr:FAD-dependent oxidoreductase [Clostridium sp.]